MAKEKDSKINKTKAFVIKALMKNKKFARQISEAWDAPVGSTKNAQAKALLKSIYQSRANYNYAKTFDGRGAGESSLSIPNFTPANQLFTPATSSGLNYTPANTSPPQYNVVKTIDKFIQPTKFEQDISKVGPQIFSGISKIGEIVGTGARKGLSAAAGMVSAPTVVGSNYIKGGVDYFLNRTERTPEYGDIGDIMNVIYPWDKKPSSNVEKTIEDSPLIGNDKSKRYIRYNDEPEIYDKETRKHINSDEALNIKDFWSNVENYKGEKPILATQGDYVRFPLEEGKKPIIPTQGEYVGFPLENPNIVQDIFNDSEVGKKIMEDPNIDNSTKELLGPAYTAAVMKELQGYVDTGLGPETTAMLMMQNPKKVAALLGMSEEEFKLLPPGFMARNLGELRKTVEKEYELEASSTKILNMISQNNNVESDLSAYIRGKDEYLGMIDKMIDNFETSVSKMDTSNPYVQQRMENYGNYLTILKGRQNQRYIDFLNAGTKEYQKQVDQMTALFNTNLKRAEDAYADGKENFDNIKLMIKDLYNNMTSREEKNAAILKNQQETQKVADDHLKTLWEIEKIKADISGKGATPELSASMLGQFPDVLSFEDPTTKKRTILDYNPIAAINKISDITGGYHQDAGFNEWSKIAGNMIYSSANEGAMSEINKFSGSLANLNDAYNGLMDENKRFKELEQTDYDKLSDEEKTAYDEKATKYNENLKLANQFGKYFATLRDSIHNNITSGLSAKLKDQTVVLREAINSMLNVEKWISPATKENFIATYKGKLGEEISAAIWDDTMASVAEVKAGEKSLPEKDRMKTSEIIMSMYGGEDVTNEELPTAFAGVLSDYFTEKILYSSYQK